MLVCYYVITLLRYYVIIKCQCHLFVLIVYVINQMSQLSDKLINKVEGHSHEKGKHI